MFLSASVVCSNLFVVMAASILSNDPTQNEVITYDFPYVTRSEWHARNAKQQILLNNPMPYVVLHHSHYPPACHDMTECKEAMRTIQNFHMDDRNWWDVGYNFAVGGDGYVYEGRGWTIQGAHSLHFNNVSIGICLIGNFINDLPPANQIKSAQALIAAGVEMGYLKPDYQLIGHRQVRETDCPGDMLYKEIQHWAHYSTYPASVRDLPALGIQIDE